MTQSSKVSFIASLQDAPMTSFIVEVERLQADEERLLEVVQPNSQEAIVSCLSLQWVNDLPGQCHALLKRPTQTFTLL
jgi:hypothetical protein